METPLGHKITIVKKEIEELQKKVFKALSISIEQERIKIYKEINKKSEQ